VAVDGRALVGTVRLWNLAISPGRDALLLGPLAVHPTFRNRGIGTALVRCAVARARLAGHGAIVLVGDAAYYRRFGFTALPARNLWMPGCFDRDQLLALELRPGALAGARGLIGAAGRYVPTPDLAALVVRELAAQDVAVKNPIIQGGRRRRALAA